jgi:predicted secreted protein
MWLAGLLALLALVGCGQVEEVRLDETDNGTALTISPRSVVIITLAANPAAGFGWEVYDGEGTVLVADGLPIFEPGPGTGGETSAGGTQTFRFTPGASGQTRLVLGYRGPDDPVDELPAQTFSVDVAVEMETPEGAPPAAP